MPCIFCNPNHNIIFENAKAYAVYDGFPVTDGHMLIIPKRHTPRLFDLTPFELFACYALLKKAKVYLEIADKRIKGFNVGVNVGEAAGQTVHHCHIHLIPRRIGDVENPRGGVRHVISGKGYY